MGVPISGPTYIYGDNMSVVNNATKPESTLKKKSNSIFYHAIRESVSMDGSRVTHIPTTQNCADLATTIIPGGMKSNALNVVNARVDTVSDYTEVCATPFGCCSLQLITRM